MHLCYGEELTRQPPSWKWKWSWKWAGDGDEVWENSEDKLASRSVFQTRWDLHRHRQPLLVLCRPKRQKFPWVIASGCDWRGFNSNCHPAWRDGSLTVWNDVFVTVSGFCVVSERGQRGGQDNWQQEFNNRVPGLRGHGLDLLSHFHPAAR